MCGAHARLAGTDPLIAWQRQGVQTCVLLKLFSTPVRSRIQYLPLVISDQVQLADRPVSIVLLTANGSEWSGTLAEPLEISIPVTWHREKTSLHPGILGGLAKREVHALKV